MCIYVLLLIVKIHTNNINYNYTIIAKVNNSLGWWIKTAKKQTNKKAEKANHITRCRVTARLSRQSLSINHWVHYLARISNISTNCRPVLLSFSNMSKALYPHCCSRPGNPVGWERYCGWFGIVRACRMATGRNVPQGVHEKEHFSTLVQNCFWILWLG